MIEWETGSSSVSPTGPSASTGRAGDAGGQDSGMRSPSHTASSRSRITIFTRSYPPAYLTGGPARSLFALVEILDDFRFSVITSAFDDPAARPMDSVDPSRWYAFGHAVVWYELMPRMSARRVVSLLRETSPRLVYLNSLFDYSFGILPLLITRMVLRKTPVMLAPRGELSAGALALKRRKKLLFITAFRLLRLHKSVTWHASTSQEKADIERTFGVGVRSHVAVDLRIGLFRDGQERDLERRPADDRHDCSIVFFSRIVPKKNVATVIRAISLVKAKVRLSIAGPVEDGKYWAQCLELVQCLNDPEMVRYLGVIPAGEAESFLSQFDLLVLPTFGENFGHVVLESLAASTPVIVGRDTPWSQIEAAGAGWMCDPANPAAVAELIQHFADLDADARNRMRLAARSIAKEIMNDTKRVDANRAMFQALTTGGIS